VDLEYEHIPDFPPECKMIGHSIDNCYRWKKEEELRGNKENITRQKVPEKKKKREFMYLSMMEECSPIIIILATLRKR
jgi:hypothetical protein